MERYRQFLSDMFPVVRESIKRHDPTRTDHELTTLTMNEIYRLWESEEKHRLPRVYGVKLSAHQRDNAGLTHSLDPRETMSRFLDENEAPDVIQVDTDKEHIYLTVNDELDGAILRDWCRYKLRGVVNVQWHYLDE